MKNRIDSHIEKQKQLDLKFPNRHVEIHKGCCKHCPSNSGISDPESDEIKTYPKELIVKEFLFVCAWRNNKLCKGLCDKIGIDEDFIKSVNDHKPLGEFETDVLNKTLKRVVKDKPTLPNRK